ncbi:hypothetical protein QNH20_13265 [Neobacillus sp. WH10]|uniref:hypothetical protein n=1 Tax=Neobacillus sp. WH10 TaxID=3047873 RepID=UPI0024C1F10C|nr:hypothetical protein [Neobacillus sp. WH10]WHY75123.1 hypothetical protein QNH20_13265 [Neobacillus sp. WH10]
MIGLILAILIFNLIAFKKNKILTGNQIVHIWTFTIAFQFIFDMFVEFKYHGYWYFDKEIDLAGLVPHLFLVPAVNMIFLNWYPYKKGVAKQIFYMIFFVLFILLYEFVTLLPEPWGYFHYGWWRIWHTAVINPILLLILLGYYKWICKLEKNAFCKLI